MTEGAGGRVEGLEAEVEALAVTETGAPLKKWKASQWKTLGMRWDRGDWKREREREREGEDEEEEIQKRLKVEEFGVRAEILEPMIRKEREEKERKEKEEKEKRRKEKEEKERKEKEEKERRRRRYQESRKEHCKVRAGGKMLATGFSPNLLVPRATS